MKKAWWSLFTLILFFGGLGAIYYVTEYQNDKIPQNVRSFCKNAVREVRDRWNRVVNGTVQNDEPVYEIVNHPGDPTPKKVVKKPAAKPAAPKQVAQQAAPAEDDLYPDQRGVFECSSVKEAGWGICRENVPFRNAATGEQVGKASLGTILDIKSHRKSETGKGNEAVGEIRGHAELGTVAIHASKLHLFTGKFEKLSQKQQDATVSYYKLKVKLEQRKAEIDQLNAAKSPYFQEAVAAKKKFDQLAEEALKVEAALKKSAAGKQQADLVMKQGSLKGDLAVQKDKVKELSEKHKQWKNAHASELLSSAQDDQTLDIREEMNKLSMTASGLCL